MKGKVYYERNFCRLRLSGVLEFPWYCGTPANFRLSFKFYYLPWQSKHSELCLWHTKLFILICFVTNWRWPYMSWNWTCQTVLCHSVVFDFSRSSQRSILGCVLWWLSRPDHHQCDSGLFSSSSHSTCCFPSAGSGVSLVSEPLFQ